MEKLTSFGERAEAVEAGNLGQLEIKKKIPEVSNDLRVYGEKHALRGLEGRVQRGLDPAGMLAVKETREKLEVVAGKLGVSIEEVEALTDKLHVGAIWEYADKLAQGSDPDIKAWMIAADATNEKDGDMTGEEFIQDLKRVNEFLDGAVRDPEAFARKAKEVLVLKSKEQFSIEDGVPVSELDNGFLAMAVNGHKSGIVKDKDGLLFVGADELDYGVLEASGLKAEEREDRGRKNTFYVDEKGEPVVKKLYSGFAIVLNGNMETAKVLARTAEAESAEKQ